MASASAFGGRGGGRSGAKAAGTSATSAAQRSGWRIANCHRRERSGRSADDRHAVDPEMVEEVDEGVRLVLRGRIVGEVGAQVAEAGGRHDLPARGDERLRERKPLVEAAAGSVDHQHRRPGAGDRILHGAEAALEDLAPAAGSRPGLGDLGRERPPDGAAGERRTGADEPENEKPPPSHGASIARRPPAAQPIEQTHGLHHPRRRRHRDRRLGRRHVPRRLARRRSAAPSARSPARPSTPGSSPRWRRRRRSPASGSTRCRSHPRPRAR